MVTGKIRQLLTYKAQARGINIVLKGEKYTSQTRPACSERHKPNGGDHVYECGFRCHRAAVGSRSISQEHQGCGPAIGAMTSSKGECILFSVAREGARAR